MIRVLLLLVMVGRRRWWTTVVVAGAVGGGASQRLSTTRLPQLGARVKVISGGVFKRRHSRRRSRRCAGVSTAGARRSFLITSLSASLVVVQGGRSDRTQ